MEPAFATPQQLVEGLRERSRAAHRQLVELLQGPVERLMRELITRHRLDEDCEIVTAHALRLAENHLRFRDPAAFAHQSWGAFRAAVLVDLARLALQPATGPRSLGDPSAVIIPGSAHYQSEVFIRPFARLGNQFFGGDWCAGRRLPDDSLWVFLADVTGHGYYAYLLARGLHALWQDCWAGRGAAACEPAELLATMHEQLAGCLPEGTFLECTLARLRADGSATVVPAGGSRLLVRQGTEGPREVKLRGAWLGLAPPRVEEQYDLHLAPGDEVVLTTDGAIDQLEKQGGLEAAARGDGAPSLLAALRRGLEASLAAGPQLDDITLVLIRRRAEPSEGSHVRV